jgi:hypothetical protein
MSKSFVHISITFLSSEDLLELPLSSVDSIQPALPNASQTCIIKHFQIHKPVSKTSKPYGQTVTAIDPTSLETGRTWQLSDWHLSSWTHLTEQQFSHQTPCRTAKELTAGGTVDLIPSTCHKLVTVASLHGTMHNACRLHGADPCTDCKAVG